jgi:CHASE1-domain containing sensor protein
VSAVVVLGSGLSFGASAGWRDVLREEAGVRFDQAEEQDAHAVRRELERYESALVAARALLSSGDTSAPDFAAFADALDLRGRYPSLQAVNWTAAVQEGDLDAYVAERRADGAPAFTVFGAGAGARGEEHRVITYVARWPATSPPSASTPPPGRPPGGPRTAPATRAYRPCRSGSCSSRTRPTPSPASR